MSQLPKGWVVASLDDITSDVSYGVTAKSDPIEGDLKLLRITDIQDNKVDWSSVPYCTYETKYESSRLQDNDIVVARTGATVGKSFLIENAVENSVYASYLIRLRLAEGTLPKYLACFLHTPSYWQQVSEQKAGIGQPNVNGTKLKTLKLPLAPLAEQTRIVEKLDEVLAQVDTIKARLDGIPAILKRFRQSVLAAAVSGKLTEEWRGECGALGQDLGLIERTKVGLINDKTVKKDLNFEISNKIFDIPDTWSFLKLKSLSSKITDGEHKTPTREESGRYLLSARNVRDGYLSLDNVDYVGEEEYQKLRKRCDPNKGDVLISCSGSVGRISLVDADDKYVMVRSAALVKVIDDFLLNSYLVYVLQSPELQKRIEESSKSTAQSNLFLGPIKELEIPLPSMEEQKEIVRLVDQYFAFADTIEAQVKKAQARVDKLTQSILAKAFRGELVPQDPNDEPADKLLERIALARKEAEVLAKAAKKTAKK
ncbi:restriction endonuclease subunit S [Vibrio cholerae]